MTIGQILDVLLVVLVAAAAIAGFARGLLRTLGAALGLVAGGAAALVVMPFVSREVPAVGWNVVAALAAGLLLLGLGAALGGRIGRAVRRSAERAKLAPLDRVLGAAANLGVSLATVLVLAMSVTSFGVPALSQAVASSSVLRFLQSATPEPVEAALARLRSAALEDGIPTMLEAAGIDAGRAPDADADTAALDAAARSVLRITTNSPACSTSSSGSGFVVSDGVVMTNAHVVAGAQEIVVEESGAIPEAARLVYFDPAADIAVLRADGLTAAPLRIAADPAAGDTVFFQGYPYGGPFASRSAAALVTGPLLGSDVGGGGTVTRSVTTIAGEVRPGNSGGPLLTADGAVAGMIFAKSDTSAEIGFALSMAELAPVLALAESLSEPVASGSCTA
ncbi:MarP family serine protease [Leucobacter allii]|uniref:MarP family serine protease n=1 Tax=Leucobacter allii TaxID=2932247 RepID=A0ABY4FKK1_9MICO|nr:MarP family serine protease [Leucobacter allii]UOQ56351.1 MarP family serine protease [Leucobacter allii]